MIDIIVMEIQNEGNLGAISRAMANFGFKNLVLVRPGCDKDSIESIKVAKHSKEVLDKIRVVDDIEDYDYLIGTTAKLGNDYNIPRSPLSPEQLGEKLSSVKSKIGILIGREGDGLTNEEIRKCDFVVTIPASKKYPTLNISHALAIILYEIAKKRKNVTSHIIPAKKKDKDIMNDYLCRVLDRVEFATKEKKETQKIVWRRIFGKAMMTKRETFAVMGFLKKLLK